MAKRYPLSRASREYERLLGLYPWLERLVAPYPGMNSGDDSCMDMSWNVLEACSAKTGIPIETALNAAFGEGDWVLPDDLPWIARWRACRHVYRIDETVAGELAGQGLDGELPCEALRRMPYPIIYVDSRVPVSYPSGIRAAHGFFAYIDRDFTGEIDLALIYIMEDGSRSRLSLIVEDGTTLASCIDHVKKIDMAMAEMSGGSIVRAPDEDEEAWERFRRCVTATLNLMLFVLSTENGAEIIYAPPRESKGQKVGKRTNLETVRLLGAKIGRSIGEARRSGYSSCRGAGDRTVAPHVRRAHWQSFWTGKRKGRDDGKFGDELIVKWIPPIPINEDAGEVVETIHR